MNHYVSPTVEVLHVRLDSLMVEGTQLQSTDKIDLNEKEVDDTSNFHPAKESDDWSESQNLWE